MPASVFISYASADEAYRLQLETHLAPLKREGLLETWTFRDIAAGADWQQSISERLEAAEIVLLLVSASFIASEYCYGVELRRALEKHEAGETLVIPVIIRSCDWHHMPFARLQALPRAGRPISNWKPRDGGWLSVASGIRNALQNQHARPLLEHSKSPAVPLRAADVSLLPLFHLLSSSFSSDTRSLDVILQNHGPFITCTRIQSLTSGAVVQSSWGPNTLPTGEKLRIPTRVARPDPPECVYLLIFKDMAGHERALRLTIDRRTLPARLDFEETQDFV